MIVWVVGWNYEFEYAEDEKLFAKEEKARAYEAELKRLHQSEIDNGFSLNFYCYSKEVIE